MPKAIIVDVQENTWDGRKYYEYTLDGLPGKRYKDFFAGKKFEVGQELEYEITSDMKKYKEGDIWVEWCKIKVLWAGDTPKGDKKPGGGGFGGQKKADPLEIAARHENTVLMQAATASQAIVVAFIEQKTIKDTLTACNEFLTLYRAFKQGMGQNPPPKEETRKEAF